MSERKTTIWNNGLIWFGAGVSIAEILTGALVAPLGFTKGLATIIIGHLLGCILLFAAGLIGGQTNKSAMETVKISFGQKGSLLFAVLNVVQLLGWTAIMIFNGAIAANSVFDLGSPKIWGLIIGVLIGIWILIGINNLGKLNIVAMSALFVLTIILSKVVFTGDMPAMASETGMTVGLAIELSIAMPLSWLPLISDYTRTAEKPFKATLASAGTYFFVSCWMYVIGMGAAIFTGESDVTAIMLKAGLGVIAIIIVILSTVTTTFLDAYSAGVSFVSISNKIGEKKVAIVVTIIGTLLAMFTTITKVETLLYFIGSVFAPMIAILLTDYFILKKDKSRTNFDVTNIVIWLIGFVAYRISMNFAMPIGNTIPVMVLVICLSLIMNKIIFKGELKK
ncbi:MAG: putative hydroxymethylpyrimidine transporter CytX [Anaerovoracaceae bacterium]